MTARFSIRCMALSFFVASYVPAQTVPICPTSPYIFVLRIAPGEPGGPPISDRLIQLLIQQTVSSNEYWQFKLQDATRSGNVISGNAPGIGFIGGFSGLPNQVGIFGPLPAGEYSIVVQPIATNVTPNVNCPLLTIPLTVLQGNEFVPVPAVTGTLAALLGSLLAGMGALVLRLRRRARGGLRQGA